MQVDYQGCMRINVGDKNFARNVQFENIRVEDFRQGQLLTLRVFYNKRYDKAPGAGIENVLFKNITGTGGHAGLSVIAGYDDARMIKAVTFDNLVINGAHISDTRKQNLHGMRLRMRRVSSRAGRWKIFF